MRKQRIKISCADLDAGRIKLPKEAAGRRLPLLRPGKVLREEFLTPLGISVRALARDIEVPANRVSEILNGE